jgi:hypothetical protein
MITFLKYIILNTIYLLYVTKSHKSDSKYKPAFHCTLCSGYIPNLPWLLILADDNDDLVE